MPANAEHAAHLIQSLLQLQAYHCFMSDETQDHIQNEHAQLLLHYMQHGIAQDRERATDFVLATLYHLEVKIIEAQRKLIEQHGEAAAFSLLLKY